MKGAGRDGRAGISRRHDGVHLFCFQQVDADRNRGIFFLPKGGDRRVPHPDDLGSRMDDDFSAEDFVAVQFVLKGFRLADEHDFQLGKIVGGLHGAFDNDLRAVIAPHAIDCDADHFFFFFSLILTVMICLPRY